VFSSDKIKKKRTTNHPRPYSDPIMASRGFASFASNDSGYDSSITEVFDCETSRPRFNPQEYARDVARQRQHLLAGELSRLDADEYQQDILDHMMRMDVCFA
jgi:hypothetical protein